MQEEERLITTGFREEDEDAEQSLRPRTLAEYFGQDKLKKSLSVYMQAALARREPLDRKSRPTRESRTRSAESPSAGRRCISPWR